MIAIFQDTKDYSFYPGSKRSGNVFRRWVVSVYSGVKTLIVKYIAINEINKDYKNQYQLNYLLNSKNLI